MAKSKIKKVHARHSWDDRGSPAIEIDVVLRYGARGRALAPLPADAVAAAQDMVSGITFAGQDLNDTFKGKPATDQPECDRLLTEMAKAPDFSPVQAAVLRAFSQACLLAAADSEKLPLWQYLGTYLGFSDARSLPLPILEVLSRSGTGNPPGWIESIALVPLGANSFYQALTWERRVRHHIPETRLPADSNDQQILEQLTKAIEAAGLRPLEDVALALRLTNEITPGSVPSEPPRPAQSCSSDALSGTIVDWVSGYPVVSVENPFAFEELEAYRRLTWAIGKRVQVIGPAQTEAPTANAAQNRLQQTGNAILLADPALLTLSDLKVCKDQAVQNLVAPILPTRSGLLTGTLPVHLAVGWGVGQIRSGPPGDMRHAAIWREALRIAEAIAETQGHGQTDGHLPPRHAFAWG